MYVAVTGSGKAKVIQFREDTRIPGTNKKKTRVVKTLGNYERMLAEDPDIIAKLKREAAEITRSKKQARAPLELRVSTQEIFQPDDVVPSYSFGHALVKQLWLDLSLDTFFLRHAGKKNADAVAQALYYLVAHRCAEPASIRKTSADQSFYAGVEPLGLDLFYDVLNVLADRKDDLILHLNNMFERKTDRRGPEAYYDVTTYAFESTRWGELRMFGFSKDHKHNEVQGVMGLLLDSNGLPITYQLFPGNTMDQNTLEDSVKHLQTLYRLEKITVVADRGLNSGANLALLCSNEHDFVISYTLKRSPQSFRELVWDTDNWTDAIDSETGQVTFRSKTIRQNLEVRVPLTAEEMESQPRKPGRPRKYEIREIPVHVHLTWSAKRAAKDRKDRERLLERLRKNLDSPSRLKAKMRRGGNQYLQMELDTENWRIDEKRIEEAARYDGYYAVITNNLERTTEEVVSIYRGLWKIEESFRVLKTDLRACPVFVWSDEHIKGHFAMCFVSLCLIRYAQYLLESHKGVQYSAARIMDAIREPLALVQGTFPENIVTPTRICQEYLDLAEILKLPALKTNMTLTQFRSSTKLDLSRNLK